MQPDPVALTTGAVVISDAEGWWVLGVIGEDVIGDGTDDVTSNAEDREHCDSCDGDVDDDDDLVDLGGWDLADFDEARDGVMASAATDDPGIVAGSSKTQGRG